MSTQETRLQDREAIAKFKQLVKDVNVCMFTTIDEQQQLSSRPMFTSQVDNDGDVWFFTNEFSEKVGAVSRDNLVHLIYAHPVKNIYIDGKGTCSLVIDRKKMEALWDESLKQWFPQGPEDPKLCLIKVTLQSAHFWNQSTSKMGLMFQMIRSIAKGDKYQETEKGKLDFSTPEEN